MKGNHTNHKLKWARNTDLLELKERFIKFVENDFMSLYHKVLFQDTKINFIIGLLALILALIAVSIFK